MKFTQESKGTEFAKMAGRERGYFYLQDFIPNNDSDIRVIVIKYKAFAIKRLVREGDFRASGSGNIEYINDRNIDVEVLKIAFRISNQLKLQCVAFDFIYNQDKEPLIIEISYGFAMEAYNSCEGFWDSNLQWFSGTFYPQNWIVSNLMS